MYEMTYNKNSLSSGRPWEIKNKTTIFYVFCNLVMVFFIGCICIL